MYTQDGESKYHVANILSGMANGGPISTAAVTYAVPSAAHYASGIIAGSTSSLTPTTLNNIEQTFIELQSVPTNTTVQNPVTQSGFVPPIVNSIPSDDPYGSDSSNSCDSGYYQSPPKRVRIGDKTTTIMSQQEIENPRRKTHRRQLRDEDVTPEEADRRRLRRERNKVAAAKCRQRRVDHTNRLLNETDKLEHEQQKIEAELQALQQEKDQLEFILQAHNPICKVGGKPSGIKVKTEPEVETSKPCTILKKELPSTSRPSTLSLLKRDVKNDLTSAGITLTTPSSGFCSFSLDTMVDHTGLTPLTGTLGHTGLTPTMSLPNTCSSESKKLSTSSDSSDNVKSPSSLIAL